jgi:glutaredoxin 3
MIEESEARQASEVERESGARSAEPTNTAGAMQYDGGAAGYARHEGAPTAVSFATPRASSRQVPRVVVYSAPFCPFCVRAKRLLEARAIVYDEVDVAADPAVRARVMSETGRRTVPQIFIDGVPIGGFEELVVLDREGALAALSTPVP